MGLKFYRDYDGIHWGSSDQRVRLIRTHCVCICLCVPANLKLLIYLSMICAKSIGNSTGSAHGTKSCIILVAPPWLQLVTGNPLLRTRMQHKDSVKSCVSFFVFWLFNFILCSSNSWFTSHCMQRICFRETQIWIWLHISVYSPCHLPSLLVYPLTGCQETETALPQVNLRAQLLNLLKSEEALLAAGTDAGWHRVSWYFLFNEYMRKISRWSRFILDIFGV